MNTWHTSARTPPPAQTSPDWFEAVLPLSATPLILLLFLTLPVFLLTAESLFAPVYDFFHSLLIPVNAGISVTSLPFYLFLKIAIFIFFTFTGLALLLLKISCIYHEVWSGFFPQPDARHTPYHPDQQQSMISLFNWNIFRWYRIIGPFLAWLAAITLAGTTGLLLFSSFTDFGFMTFQLQVTAGMFVMSVLFLFAGLSLVQGGWKTVTTVLGDVAAITEPEKPAQVLYDRSQKLAFLSPMAFLLYPLYFIFLAGVTTEIVLFVFYYDIQDILAFKETIMIVFAFELITFILFILISAMKFMTYHDALSRYYSDFTSSSPGRNY